MAVSWLGGFITLSASGLAIAKNRNEFEAELQKIEKTLATWPYPAGNQVFWRLAYAGYREEPMAIRKETMDAASCREILAGADAALRKRSGL